MADDETPADPATDSATATAAASAESPAAVPADATTSDEPDQPSAIELHRATIDRRLAEISAKALQAKRQNMLDNLADAVADLVALMRETLYL